MQNKFKIGDKVKFVRPHWEGEYKVIGKEGVIVALNDLCYGVKFKDFDEGHSLGGYLAEGTTSGFWCSENQLELIEETLEDAIKAFEEEHNITITGWEENNDSNRIPETIPLGQIMKVVYGAGEEELVMLVQVDSFKYNLMCLVEGNRLLSELPITRQDGVFSTKEIEKNSGWKIIELLDNPFKD